MCRYTVLAFTSFVDLTKEIMYFSDRLLVKVPKDTI